MYQFHSNAKIYFQIQKRYCEEFLIPFIEEVYPLQSNLRILEIGCGEAGILAAFLERKCICVGIELNNEKIEKAKCFLSPFLHSGQFKPILSDIFQIKSEELGEEKFDLIVLKDVIEHIRDRTYLINQLKNFLRPQGIVFVGFPPWQMPFGGHQQICKSKFLSHLPFFHLFPMRFYNRILKKFGESSKELIEIKKTGLSIEQFEKIICDANYTTICKRFFLINPIYKYKFNIKSREQFRLIQSIPYFRNFLTTASYYLIRLKS